MSDFGDIVSGEETTVDNINSGKPAALFAIASKENQTELENSARFVRNHRERIGYVHNWNKWAVFTGKRWEIDTAGHAKRLAKQTATGIMEDAVESGNYGAIQFAARTSTARGISSMLSLAEPDLAIDHEQFDADSFLLNCENGTIDLTTGKLRPHDRNDYLSKLCPTRYNPDANTSEWVKFLQSLFHCQDEVEYLQRFYGYCLTGDVREQGLDIHYGDGANGKSTHVEAMLATLGPDYSMSAPSEMLMDTHSDRHPTEKADLFGKRLVIASETEANRTLKESMVKQLTGGDTIRARRMREDFWEFRPTHKLVLLTNHKPQVRGQDHAIWRRLRLVPFVKRFWDEDKGESGPPELKADKTLSKRLKGMREAILAWAVEGCLQWQSDGLGMSQAMRDATAEYKSESDVIGRFVHECCLRNEHMKVRGSALNEALGKFCEETGDKQPNPKDVSRWMTDQGIEKKHSGGIWYLGIGLKYDSESE